MYGVMDFKATKVRHVFLLSFAFSMLSGCNGGGSSGSSDNGQQAGDDASTGQVCGESSILSGDNKFDINTYASLACQNSSDLSGTWLVISDWEQNLTDNFGYTEQTKGLTRKIVFVEELPEDKLKITSCGGYDAIFANNQYSETYVRSGDEWSVDNGTEENSGKTDRYSVQLHSNDRLTATHTEGYGGFGSGRGYSAEMEWIKIGASGSDKTFGSYSISSTSESEGALSDNVLTAACFKESEGEIQSSYVEGSKPEGVTVYDTFTPYYEFYAQDTSDAQAVNSIEIETIEGGRPEASINDESALSGQYESGSSVGEISGDFIHSELPLTTRVYINVTVN